MQKSDLVISFYKGEKKMQICKIMPVHLEEALGLVWDVFLQYDAPDYDTMGIETFRHFIRYENMLPKVQSGEMVFWGCYDGSQLAGVIALRTGQHVSLLFVRKEYQKKGIGKRLIQVLWNHVMESDPEIRAITVNSSPCGVEFYKRVGFCPLGAERTENGIRFTPMRSGGIL